MMKATGGSTYEQLLVHGNVENAKGSMKGSSPFQSSFSS